MPGKRYSRQRELIYHAILQTNRHPTAEMVYQWLKPTCPNLSLGTVYRNLNLLAEEGLLIRMPFPVERYDARTFPHPHFRCQECGEVYDMALPYNSALDAGAASAQKDFRIDSHDLTFTGLCPNCRRAEADN